jgi:type II secretory pathway pseudopilin PulG
MIGWFTALAAPQKAAALGVVVVFLGLVALVAINWADMGLDRAEEKGAAVERARTAEAVIEQGVKANEAAQRVRTDPPAYCGVCMRTSRTPENCRFTVPGVQGYQLCPALSGRDERPR